MNGIHSEFVTAPDEHGRRACFVLHELMLTDSSYLACCAQHARPITERQDLNAWMGLARFIDSEFDNYDGCGACWQGHARIQLAMQVHCAARHGHNDVCRGVAVVPL